MPFFTLHGVSGLPVLSGLTGRIPWNNIATLYFYQSKADAIHMHLSIPLSPQLHSLIKYDCCIIFMKHYTWILTKRKAANLYMICVRSAYPVFAHLLNLNRSTLYACCPPTIQNLTPINTKQSLGLFSNTLQCPEEHCSNSHQTGSANHPVWQSQSS